MPDIDIQGATYPDVPAVDLPKSGGGTARFYDPSEILYAASNTSGGPAIRTNGLPYGVVDGTSTETALTVQIPGITELYDGLCILVKNNVASSNTNCTLNVNSLGAKRIHYSTALDTAITTQWSATITALFYYDSSRNSGDGAWVYYYGTTVPTKTSDLTNDSGYITGMYIASYGSSTYAEVLAAYQANKVVYCRASSNANPGTGSQNRMAFLAYVNDSTTPTEMEFQYYRSVSSHSDSQQGDQVYVYKLKSNGTWSVTIREAYTKINPSTGLTKSYSNGVLTVSVTNPLPAVTSTDNGKVLMVANGAWAAASLPVYNGGVS